MNFYIDLNWKADYISAAILEELNIASIDTGKIHFFVCGNSNCKSVFMAEAANFPANPNFLCPKCEVDSKTNHIIQCRSCLTVLGIYRTDDNEMPNVFYAEKCHNCFGTAEDEMIIQPFMYPHLML